MIKLSLFPLAHQRFPSAACAGFPRKLAPSNMFGSRSQFLHSETPGDWDDKKETNVEKHSHVYFAQECLSIFAFFLVTHLSSCRFLHVIIVHQSKRRLFHSLHICSCENWQQLFKYAKTKKQTETKHMTKGWKMEESLVGKGSWGLAPHHTH